MPCELKGKCGGCFFIEENYEEQLKAKQSIASEYLPGCGQIRPCPVTANYRNKMEYTFGDEFKGGPLELGMHKKGSFISIVSAEDCELVPEDFNRVLRAVKQFCIERGYDIYHKKQHTGSLRSLILRKGFRTNQLLVNLVTTSYTDIDEKAFTEAISGLQLDSELKGILHTICDNPADAVNPEEVRVLAGSDYYDEVIMDLKFKVGAFSFFQTNVEAAERLYKDALSLIPDIEDKTVFDLYCGTGTISQAMATKAKHVYGIDINAEAISVAEESAKINGLDNCTFIAGDVGEKLESITDRPDVIVVDPPRAGITPKSLEKILSYGIPQIVYISCNPKSLAKNLEQAAQLGYKAEYVCPYDNFPGTGHVETVVLMSKVK